jgi:hypothetical protein
MRQVQAMRSHAQAPGSLSIKTRRALLSQIGGKMISTSDQQTEWVYRAADCSVQQQLYESAINFEIATLAGSGFLVKLGDRLNGYKAAATFETWSEVKEWLLRQAIAHFPESKLAREHGVFRNGGG